MRLTTINEAAPLVGKSPQQLRRGIDAGRYPYVPIGNRKLVDVDELTEIIDRENATIGIEEATELTGLTDKVIRRGIREGWLPYIKEGKAYRFLPGQLIEALQGMKRKG